MTDPSRNGVTTTDRLRHNIDHSAGGDKVSFPDPAAAPLGTDDEAAGSPASPAAVAAAAQRELRRTPAGPTGPETSETGRLISGEPGRTTEATARAGFVLPLVGVLAVAVLALIAGYLVA